ncbi:MAG: hypothetical protein ABW278_02350 [Steroidobacteraceae bacterium]
MTDHANNNARRAFFLRGGATLGAGIATTAGAAALLPATVPAGDQGAGTPDREAILQLHREFIARVEEHSHPAAPDNHRAYRSNAGQLRDELAVDADGRVASGCWHVDVQVATPLRGDSTAAQMARLQGNLADLHWESGRLDVQYIKQAGRWQIARLRYAAI